jgi:outer membrane protein OmpA-like peptidoglycan-associated protein
MGADSRSRIVVALLALATGLAGCSAERIVLLPEPDGHGTAVAVKQRGRDVVLDRPYAAAELSVADPWRYTATPEEVEKTFGAALASQPVAPAHYTLYFIEGSDTLTEESKVVLEEMFGDVAKRPVPDVLVVGHTDAVGSDEFNDALARKRADAVRASLIARGIDGKDIAAIGKGKRELLIPTPDGVAEPRNRRVEIVVR